MAYAHLPRPQFSHLQSHVIPRYFQLQTLFPPLLLLTYPHPPGYNPLLLLSPSENPQFVHTAIPLIAAFVSSATNLLVVGPWVQRIMAERKQAEAQGEPQERLTALNKKFGRAHGGSALLSLVGILATGWFGWGLGKKII